jgi:molybdate transport system substrate-binding protein
VCGRRAAAGGAGAADEPELVVKAIAAWVAALLAVLAAGVPARARGADLVVFAAASLTDALREVGRAWEATSDDRVTFNFAGSSTLARQILAGAPADVFFSADRAQMAALERAGLVAPGAAVDALSNELVVVVPGDAGVPIAGPDDLRDVRRLALADPEAVPAGVYARRWLESIGLWSAVREHVVPTLDVRAALAAVEAGHADVGVVYHTDAAGSRRVRIAFEVPRAEGPPIVYTLAPLAHPAHAGAERLARFLASPAAGAVYARLGFLPLGGR